MTWGDHPVPWMAAPVVQADPFSDGIRLLRVGGARPGWLVEVDGRRQGPTGSRMAAVCRAELAYQKRAGVRWDAELRAWIPR